MTTESNSGDLRWLLEPPAPGELRFAMDFGEGAELTPEMREAFEGLLRAFDAEVEGYTPSCPRKCVVVICSPDSCFLNACNPKRCWLGTHCVPEQGKPPPLM
jgi:hypothetical protein